MIDHVLLTVSLLLKMMSGGIITYALIVQSTAVTQAKFVPLNALALIIVNALTGMIVWEDWRNVGNWVGYVWVFEQLVLGNYLLLGDVELLSPDNPRYGRAKCVDIARDLEEAALDGRLFDIEESESQEVELDGPEDSYMNMANETSPPDEARAE